eukprot:364758-Chlamydomonas_euryale.AAC.10
MRLQRCWWAPNARTALNLHMFYGSAACLVGELHKVLLPAVAERPMTPCEASIMYPLGPLSAFHTCSPHIVPTGFELSWRPA